MMGDVTALLATRPDVELAAAGTWTGLTGTFTITPDDLAAAVSSLDCPAVRRPVIKLGHTDDRFDGEPAVGYIDNLRTGKDNSLLIGDYVGIPAWLDEIMASAYPDRSIEAYPNFMCSLGHTHELVLDAVSLLGVKSPAIGVLTSLQDVATLYGIAASATPAQTSPLIRQTIKGGRPMPEPILASASAEDIRRAYYDGPGAESYNRWVQQVYVDPAQLIVCDDSTGDLYRVPYTLADNSVTFGDAVEVQIEYVDAPADADDAGQAVALSRRAGPVAVYASRGDSRPSATVAASTIPLTRAADDGGAHMPDLAQIRETFGLSADATRTEIEAAVAAAFATETTTTDTPTTATTEPATAPVVADGTVAVDAETFRELQVAASRGATAADELAAQRRDRTIGEAIKAGKFAPARRPHYEKLYESDPEGTTQLLASLEPGAVPVDLAGYAGDPESAGEGADYVRLFGDSSSKGA
jgi:hypothetical protein